VINLKKAARSAQVMAPWLQEARYEVQRRLLERTGRTWRPEIEALRWFHKDAPAIIDIGASRGFSISAMLMLKPRAAIHAFEPLVDLAYAIVRRYSSDRRVAVNSTALGRREGEMTIYTPIYRGYRLDALSSLIHDEAANWVNADRFYFFNPKKLTIRATTVQVRPLDAFEFTPDIIKLYTEGSEPDVLAGARDTIKRAKPIILGPARNPTFRAILADHGYVQYAYGKGFTQDAPGDYWEWFLLPHHHAQFTMGFK
jgi:FkbM family methyltransferase